MYLQFLKNSFASTVSIKNYLSGAKYWISHHGGNIKSFESHEVKEMLSAVSTLSNHVPTQAYPITSQDVKKICDYIDLNPSTP